MEHTNEFQPEYQPLKDDHHQFYKEFAVAEARHNRLQALKHLFKRKHFAEDFLEMPWYKKTFYWTKTLVCLLLWRTGGPDFCLHEYCIMYWDLKPSCGEYSGCDWTSCWVKMGFFKNWYISVGGDSDY